MTKRLQIGPSVRSAGGPRNDVVGVLGPFHTRPRVLGPLTDRERFELPLGDALPFAVIAARRGRWSWIGADRKAILLGSVVLAKSPVGQLRATREAAWTFEPLRHLIAGVIWLSLSLPARAWRFAVVTVPACPGSRTRGRRAREGSVAHAPR